TPVVPQLEARIVEEAISRLAQQYWEGFTERPIASLKAQRCRDHPDRFPCPLHVTGVEAVQGTDRGFDGPHQLEAIAGLQGDLPAARLWREAQPAVANRAVHVPLGGNREVDLAGLHPQRLAHRQREYILLLEEAVPCRTHTEGGGHD